MTDENKSDVESNTSSKNASPGPDDSISEKSKSPSPDTASLKDNNNSNKTKTNSEIKSAKSTKNGRTSKKRNKDNSLDQIRKELSKMSTEEEKMSYVMSKYEELFIDCTTSHNNNKLLDKKFIAVLKEKESLQTDYSKAILARSRLEDLCRELQRQNKTVKEESLSRVREEEEKRKEASGKFQTALNDLSSMLQDNQSQSTKLQEENMEMAKKLKVLFDQYNLREKHVNKLIQHSEMKSKVSDTKIAQIQATYAEDKEKSMVEKKKLLEELMALQQKCTELASSELKARTELSAYKDKYEEFQDNLKKSNAIFDNFKSEMSKMSKKIGKLEKETLEWQNKWKNTNKALIAMAEEKCKTDQLLNQSQQKISKLESLCRALQQERNELISNMKSSTEAVPESTEPSQQAAADTPVEQSPPQ